MGFPIHSCIDKEMILETCTQYDLVPVLLSESDIKGTPHPYGIDDDILGGIDMVLHCDLERVKVPDFNILIQPPSPFWPYSPATSNPRW
jgi:hypothetical protein